MKKGISLVGAGVLTTALCIFVWVHSPAPRPLSAIATRLDKINSGLWVCRSDGTAPREIARADSNESVSNLRWLPDGRHVSVIYRDALWVVPVE